MIQTAVLGYGTVGSGVVEVLETNKESIEKRAGKVSALPIKSWWQSMDLSLWNWQRKRRSTICLRQAAAEGFPLSAR